MKRTHLCCAYASTGAYILKTTDFLKETHRLPVLLLGLLPVAAGALFPDIDTPYSSYGRKHKFISTKLGLRHRGITHTLFIPALLTLCAVFVPRYIEDYFIRASVRSLIVGFLAGWLSHVFIDLFNKKGCPIFWPFSKKRIHLASVRINCWQENVFLLLYLAATVLYLMI